MPSSNFGITLNDSLITELPVSETDMLGIEVNQLQVPSCISMYEEHVVRADIGYTLNEWYNLSARERALEVALFRIKNSIEYQKKEEQERRMKKQK